VVNDARGAPSLLLHGAAAARAQVLGIGELSLSLSHTRAYAVAFVVGLASRNAV
jgi:holo-[acyl-carrier protein] synthase